MSKAIVSLLSLINHLIDIPPDLLESLLRNLSLSRRNRSLSVRVLETTSRLSSLELSGLRAADSRAASVRTACGRAISVANTATSDELGTAAGTDVLGASIVGSDCAGEGGDYTYR